MTHLVVPERLGPQHGTARLDLENPQHHKEEVDAVGSVTATGLQTTDNSAEREKTNIKTLKTTLTSPGINNNEKTKTKKPNNNSLSNKEVYQKLWSGPLGGCINNT